MQKYDEKKLKEAQLASLEILLKVDEICRANDIKYLLDSGTLIGAVRHKGFIPWDDDIDIAMTRDNYDKFRNLIKGNRGLLPDNMELILPDEYRGGAAFYDFTPRIIYLNSKRHTVNEESIYYEGKLNHLWVDIFIIDEISDNVILDRLTRLRQKIIYGSSMPRRYGTDYSKYSFVDKIRVGVLSFGKYFFSMPKLFKMQEKLSVKYDGKGTKRVYYSNYQPDYMQVTLERTWCSEVTEIPFEGHMLMAPKAYDKVLREVYGDYMQLPPEDKRIPSHNSEALEIF